MNAETPVVSRIDDPMHEPLTVERSHILIVDDRSDKRVVFRTILEELEQNIVTVGSGEEALRWLLDNECAVILLDVNMPGMDGLETAELIRSRRKSAHTPIIFITAFADEMHTARGYSLGAVDYILSPVVPNVLRSKVKALVQLHRLNAELKRRADERVALVKEQAARSAAEESQRRASFLAEATQVMASSLDVDTILKGATGLVVPFLADYSAIVLIGDDGRVRGRQANAVRNWDAYLGVTRSVFEGLLADYQELAIAKGERLSHDRLVHATQGPVGSGETPPGEVHVFPLITRGAIELRRETLEIAREIRHSLESCQGPLEAGGHELVMTFPDEPLHVVADRVRLQQILENLILNAVKYTDPGGRIEVRAETELGGVVIRVRDNGIGIAREKLPHVWDLFVQVDESPERTRKGLGIGLALVKDLVRRHGGTVEAESDGLGKGSTFTVRLPRAVRGDVAVPAAQPEADIAAGAKRVLIVDDNLDAAETLAMMLDLLGQQTRQEHDGRSALRAAEEYRPDVVFLDIGLPGLSGHEVASRIRRDLGMGHVYLIALSGYGTEEDRRKSFYAGFDSHLVKPLDPAALPGILAAAERRTH